MAGGLSLSGLAASTPADSKQSLYRICFLIYHWRNCLSPRWEDLAVRISRRWLGHGWWRSGDSLSPALRVSAESPKSECIHRSSEVVRVRPEKIKKFVLSLSTTTWGRLFTVWTTTQALYTFRIYGSDSDGDGRKCGNLRMARAIFGNFEVLTNDERDMT